MTTKTLAAASIAALMALLTPTVGTQEKSPGAGPIIVLETAKGTIEFETYPEEAPKTVARIVELVKKNFYTGLRFHRVEPAFLIQVGDQTSRDMSRQAEWGRRGSGTPIGVAEITKKRRNVLGAVAMVWLDELIWRQFPLLNLLILGLATIILVLFLPRGIVGTLLRRKPQWRRYIP